MIKDMIRILRPHQWYKNLIIFLAIIFSRNLFNLDLLLLSFYGFLILILISAANYILNDLNDISSDRVNPEKRNRPIASGKISRHLATIFLILSSGLAFYFAYLIDVNFFYCVVEIFALSTIYTLYLKNIIFADIISVSSLFVLRAVSGALIINVMISPWLVLGVLFFALFLVTGKRYGEILFLSDKSDKHRTVLRYYKKDITHSLFNIFLAILIMVFALFSFYSTHPNLLWAIPLFIFVILRYYYLILSGSIISRRPEMAYKDTQLLISSIALTILIMLLVNI